VVEGLVWALLGAALILCPTRASKPMDSSSMVGVHTVATPPGSPFHTSSTQKVADDALPIEPYSGDSIRIREGRFEIRGGARG
jgi:hypothetical protein